MSLVGSELYVRNLDSSSPSGTASSSVDSATTGLFPVVEDEVDMHPPISPKTGYEQLFLLDLNTQTISANALAQSLRTSPKFGTDTNLTSDYGTAADSPDKMASDLSEFGSPAKKDALSMSRDVSLTQDPTSVTSASVYHEAKMSEHRDAPRESAPPASPVRQASFASAPGTTTSVEVVEEVNANAAEKVYDTAKSVWGWGKRLFIVGKVLGLAEGVAGKVFEIAGSNLTEVDGCVSHSLESFDKDILNPAISAVVREVMKVENRQDGPIRSFLESFLRPVGLLIKQHAEQPDQEQTPGVTVVYAS